MYHYSRFLAMLETRSSPANMADQFRKLAIEVIYRFLYISRKAKCDCFYFTLLFPYCPETTINLIFQTFIWKSSFFNWSMFKTPGFLVLLNLKTPFQDVCFFEIWVYSCHWLLLVCLFVWQPKKSELLWAGTF